MSRPTPDSLARDCADQLVEGNVVRAKALAAQRDLLLGRRVVEDQTRNGVRVVVTRSPGRGTVVDADCQCFGAPYRAHSNPSCVNRRPS